MAKGKKTGGRKAGTPNRDSQYVAEVLERLGCEPVEGMAEIAMARVLCQTCEEKGTVPSPDGKRKRVPCPRCLGTGREPVSIGLRARMLAELASYRHPKLKAVELRGTDDKGKTVSLVELLTAYHEATATQPK